MMIGKILNNCYEIKSEVGQGAIGAVFLAWDKENERNVAVKILHEQFARNEKIIERSNRELKMLPRLEHRAIVPVYKTGTVDGRPYIVMRFMSGGTLQGLLEEKEEFSYEEIIDLLTPIVSAMDMIHGENVLHRDIKPANILLDKHGNPYLADFGFAKDLNIASSLTQSEDFFGTFNYSSPEHYSDEEISQRSDIYSLGVILFQLLGGEFDSSQPIKASFDGKLDFLPLLLQPIIGKAVDKDAEARYEKASDLLHEFKGTCLLLEATSRKKVFPGLAYASPLIGEVLNNCYEIQREIGRGGIGVVFLAWDKENKRNVAVKILHRHRADDEKIVERSKRELKLLPQLEHRGIVPVYKTGEFDGRPYIVMRFMGGDTLDLLIKETEIFSYSEIINLMTPIVKALDMIHGKGILHRDIKPANILLDEHGNPYLADFGFAKDINISTDTHSSEFFGSLKYMSPEHYSDDEISKRSDIYSLGVILFQMLGGRLERSRFVRKPIGEKLNFLPTPLRKVIGKAVASDPAERYDKASDFLDEFSKASQKIEKKFGYRIGKKVDARKFRADTLGFWGKIIRWGGSLILISFIALILYALYTLMGIISEYPLTAVAGAGATDPTVTLEDSLPPEQNTIYSTPFADDAEILLVSKFINGQHHLHFQTRSGSENDFLLEEENGNIKHPSWSPDGMKITFQADFEGADDEIYIFDLASGEFHAITDNFVQDSSPKWSPDGTKLVYASQTDGENWDIFTINVDGSSDPEQVTTSPDNETDPVWILNGTQIAYISDAESSFNLYTLELNRSSEPIQITSTFYDDYHPDWNETSGQILFYRDFGQQQKIFTIELDTLVEKYIEISATIRNIYPEWMAGTDNIIFSSNQSGDWEIYQMDSDGGEPINISNDPASDDFWPAWRP